MNSIDECFVKRLVRSFVCIISIISALISDLENTIVYEKQVTEISMRHDTLLQPAQAPKIILISAIVCVIILIVTQYKIEMFKKSVDVQAKFNQLEEDENNQVSNRTNYNQNTVRIVLSLSCVGLLLILGGGLSRPDYIHLLYTKSILTFIIIIVLPVQLRMSSKLSPKLGNNNNLSSDYRPHHLHMTALSFDHHNHNNHPTG